MTRNVPFRKFLEEEGFVPGAVPALTNAPAAQALTAPGASTGGAVDNSAVERIAMQSAQISAGVATVTAAPAQQQTLPFGQSKPAPPQPSPAVRSDPQALISKRV